MDTKVKMTKKRSLILQYFSKDTYLELMKITMMSDIDNNFLPWDWQGKYLAGCEVKEDSEAPEGWTKWVLPAFKYLSVKCNHNN